MRCQVDKKTAAAKVNNGMLKKDVLDDWQYNTKKNSTVFSASKVPAPGDSISIGYEAICDEALWRKMEVKVDRSSVSL